MAYTSVVQAIDRLAVKSVLRGSTATYAGILATLTLIVLCMYIYIPPARYILAGTYFETQFLNQGLVSSKFYGDTDFKIAIVFRNKLNNSVANHTAILEYSHSLIGEQFPDTWQSYIQPTDTCKNNPQYLKGITNAKAPQDCFIFPKNGLFNIYKRYGYYSYIYYQLFPQDDPNPFSNAGNKLSGNQNKMKALLSNYYYQIYFTSKIITKSGSSQLVLHRFYSTETEPTSDVGTSWNEFIYNVRNTTMDISIMPWLNYQTKTNLVWLGQMYNYYLLDLETASRNGVYFDVTYQLYQIRTFRYYKKLDLLVGVVGGAMLLFYILLWIPFNYINKTIHQIRNTQHLLLINNANEKEPIMEQDLTPAKVSWKYWISNPILNIFFPSFKDSQKIVMEAEKELDVVVLIKKLKVAERNLKRNGLETIFTPKILQLKVKGSETQIARQGQNSINLSQTSSIMPVQTEIEEEDFEQYEHKNIFNLKVQHLDFLRESEEAPTIFQNNMTALAIRKDENSVRFKELQQKNKFSARKQNIVKISKKRKIWNTICTIVQKFDFFGAKVNLNPGTSGSSLVGCCGILTIIFLTCLTVGLTVSNANIPQFMIYRKFQPENNFGATMKLGTDIKLAVCSYSIRQLVGSNRAANFRFFYQNSQGRRYYTPLQMTTADYAQFGLSSSNSPVDITYCLKINADDSIFLGENPADQGYFGYRIQPFCTSTPLYCSTNAATINYNYLNLVNNYYIPLYLPQNRFDPDTKTLFPNLVRQSTNLDVFYLDNKTAMEQTLYLDHVQVQDDTRNYFMRKAPTITEQGLAKNANTPYPMSRVFNSTQLYYQLKIKLSSRQVNYVVSTPKSDTILGIIGGVFVIWYSICHWLGKIYNSYQLRAIQAQTIYKEQSVDANILMKFIAISPIPLCLIPRFYDIRNDISKMRQVDKKIINQLSYLWLIKYVDNIFQLSASLFRKLEAKNLSKVYLKQKIDESHKVINQVDAEDIFENQQFFDDDDPFDERTDKLQVSMTLSNKVSNISKIQSLTDKKLNEIQMQSQTGRRNQKTQKFGSNYFQGHPKPIKMGWMDTFEYQSSLTFKGKRQVTSSFGGFCCLILLMFILIIVNFEIGIYLTRSDTKIGMTTSLIQPTQTDFSNKIIFATGTNFKLAVTFSKKYEDYPHDVSSYLINGLGISIFQRQVTKANGTLLTNTIQYPLVPCATGYLTGSVSSIVDPAYFVKQQLGYCVSDGLVLQISGLPEDKIRKTFTLSIYNKLNTTAGKENIKLFLQNFYPKFHMTSPYPDTQSQKIRYEIGSFLLDPYNITSPIQQNISISKLVISDDRQAGFHQNPNILQSYTIHPFQQGQSQYTGLPSEDMYYNLTFSNSFQVDRYVVVGDKFYETFGIIGGLIAFFIFGFGFIPKSFNEYRMKYLIGRELYLFQISKKAKDKKKKQKINEASQKQRLKEINNYGEDKILRAYFFSFFGALRQNYNIDPVLRRVTILQQKVENDLSLAEVYKKVHCFRDSLNNEYRRRIQQLNCDVADIYLMHIFNEDPDQTNVDGIGKLKHYARKYKWTAFELQAIVQALKARISLREVFDAAFLQQNFNIDQNASRANISNINPSVNFSESMGQSELMSHIQDD